jgi:hypothetical protein
MEKRGKKFEGICEINNLREIESIWHSSYPGTSPGVLKIEWFASALYSTVANLLASSKASNKFKMANAPITNSHFVQRNPTLATLEKIALPFGMQVTFLPPVS